MLVMEPHPVVQFATAARRLSAAARAAGLSVPAFRSPPRNPRALRTIRRLPGGSVIAVRLQQRAFTDVVIDMIDGVLAANRLEGEAAARVRGMLRAAVAAPANRAAA
ncbi:MAG: hypothetical protein JWL83_1111 [Actinomycetia bacterium]|nr:hypothetical protein [Actinomycetes bacterium]